MDVLRIVRVVFGAVGIGLLVGAVVAVQHTRSFLADSVSARGTVEQLVPRTSTDTDGRSSTTFAPQVRFTTADGRVVTFVSGTSSNPPGYRPGESVEVLYRADDPQQARVHDWFSLWGVASILGGLGTVFSAVGGGLTAAAWPGRRRAPLGTVPDDEPDGEPEEPEEPDDGPEEPDDDLLHHGVRVHADVQYVQPTGSFADNGSANHRIVAQWLDPDHHEVRIFTSDDIPFDPSPFLTGRTVDVLIDPHDPARHVMDLSFLPRPAR